MGRSGFDEPALDGEAGETGNVMDIEFIHDIGAVGIGGLGADLEFLCDILGRITFGDQLKDFAFAGG